MKLLYTKVFYSFFIILLTFFYSSSLKAQWIDKAESENYIARHECSVVQAGNKFYVMGGRESAKTLDVYDYGANTWAPIVNSAPEEFNHFQATEYKGLIWVIGAFKTNAFPTEQPAEFIWTFNPANQEWIQGPSIPVNRRRGSTGLVVYNDKFYISGGNSIGHDGGYVSWFDEYDPATGTWTALADAPRARDHFHAGVIGNKMYLAGGRLSGGTGGVFKPVIAEVDVYNFTTSQWSTLPAAQNLPTPRGAPSVAVFNNKLVVLGGEVQNELVYGVNRSDALEITEQYDPVTQTWTLLADLNHKRHGTQAIVSGNGIFVLAGSPNIGGGNQKNMEYFGQDAPVGTASSASTLTAPSSLVVAANTSSNFDIDIAGGNVGVIVRSMQISGAGASSFQITAGELSNALLDAGSSNQVTISRNGNASNASAILTINYGASSSTDIILTDGTTTTGIINPGTQQNIEGDNVSLQIFTSGLSNNLTYSATGLPPTLTINPSTGVISGTIKEPGTGTGTAFIEQNGLVIIEAESGTIVPGWTQTTIGGATGIIAGTNNFSSPGTGGTIPYDITVSTAGVYRFKWRNFYSGADPTEENDNWVRFPNNSDVWFFGYQGAPGSEASLISNLEGAQTDVVFPIGSSRVTTNTTPDGAGGIGYFKIYRFGGTSEVYDWQASTSDNDVHSVYVRFENPGTYTMEISERSAGHAIDRIALYKVDGTAYTDSQLTSASESQQGPSSSPGAADGSPYQVTVSVVDNNGPATPYTESFTWLVNSANSNTYQITSSAGANGVITPSGVTNVVESANQQYTITPNAGFAVADVLIDGSSIGVVQTYTFTNVTAAHTISVSFASTQHSITATAGAGGTITPLGVTSVNDGSNQQYTITPNAGFSVADVLVDGSSIGVVQNYTFTNVTAAHTISVTFETTQYTITASAGAGGTITPVGDTSVAEGSNQQFTITPNAGFSVADVLVDGSSVGIVQEYTFTNVTEAHTISVSFESIQNIITSSAGAGGTITPLGDTNVTEGSNQLYTITPNAGFSVADVLVDGSSIGVVQEYTFTNVTVAHTISVSFEADPISHIINASAGAGGTITPEGDTSVIEGSNQQYTITANGGFSVADVVVDGSSIGIVQEYTFTNVTEAHTISVSFESAPNTYIITATAASGGVITPSGETGVVPGSSQEFIITADAGFMIADVVVDNVSIGVEESYMFTNVTENHSINVTFTQLPEIDKKGLVVYPNPASDDITLVLPDAVVIAYISIFDISGKYLQTLVPIDLGQSAGYAINISTLSAGIYGLQVYDVDGNKFQQKLLIRR